MMEILTKHKEENNLNGKSDKSIAWLAHSSELLDQAAETLKNVWGNKGSGKSSIIRLYNTKVNFKNIDLTNSFIFHRCS